MSPWSRLFFRYIQCVKRRKTRLRTCTSSVQYHICWSDIDDAGIYLKYRNDGGIFHLRRLWAKTKVAQTLIRELLFADDCAIMPHTLEHIQKLMDCFANATKRFGLTFSLKKTEVMLQPCPGSSPPKPVNDTPLNVNKFCYLGSVLSPNAEINYDITRQTRIRFFERTWCSPEHQSCSL